MQRIAVISPLRHRPFLLLFSGQVVSNLGDWLDYLAIVVLIVYQWRLGAGALAAFSITSFLPIVAIGPVAGVAVDRWSPRATMIICDLIRAALVIGLVWAPNIYIALLIVGAKVTVSTFFNPAQQSLIRSTVPEDELLPANSLTQLSTQATKVLGPSIGGLIVAFGSTRAAFIGDSLSFLLSAAILSQLPHMTTAIHSAVSLTKEEKNFWREFREGFSHIFRNRILAIAISSMALALFIIFTFDVLGALALQSLGFNPSQLGLAVGSIGLGTAVGAIVLGQWSGSASPLKVMASGDVVAGMMVAAIGGAVLIHLKTFPAYWIIIWLIIGFAAAALLVPYGYILQKETPHHLMGRVSATALSLQTALQLLAPLAGAFIAGSFGVGAIFFVAGIALAFVGIILFFVPFQTINNESISKVEDLNIGHIVGKDKLSE